MPSDKGAPIHAVLDNDLCIACGACIPACPENVITPAYSKARGAQEVVIQDTSHCAPCSKPCGKVCPSIHPLAAIGPNQKMTRTGPIESIHIGHSGAYQFNGVSSSGGIIREICHYFLSRGQQVICLTENNRDGRSSYEAGLMEEVQDLDRMPGSIYHSVGFVLALEIIRKQRGPFVLVAIPCHLEGISNYIALRQPELADRISMRVGIICGWMYSDHGIANFAEAHGIDQPVLDAKYRGEDKVGKLKIRTTREVLRYDRRRFETTRDMVFFRSSFSTDVNRLRCRLCQNHINIQSDISVGDAWLARYGSRKLSIIVSRTPQGEALMEELRNEGRVTLEPGSIADIEESQSKNLVYGHSAQVLGQIMGTQRIPVMDYGFDQNLSKVSFSARLQFKFEKVRRHFLRAGQYRTYRILYVLSKPKPLLSFLIGRIR